MTKCLARVALASILLLGVHPAGALAVWTVDERGDCVQQWVPGSLARGPTAVLNAPLAPFRSAAGGAQLALENPSRETRTQILLPPLLTLAGGGMGLIDTFVWAGTGLVDTATGGYFEIAPSEATELSLAPIRPAFSSTVPSREAERVDRCGRRLDR
jgi:hypothetical protein